MTFRRGSPESFDIAFNGGIPMQRQKERHGAQFSHDLTRPAVLESFEPDGPTLLTDAQVWKRGKANRGAPDDSWQLLSGNEAVSYLSKKIGMGGMDAAKALAGGLEGTPRPKSYNERTPYSYDSRDLDDWVEKHGHKFAPKNPKNTWKPAVEHA
jgi:hypothetical protein